MRAAPEGAGRQTSSSARLPVPCLMLITDRRLAGSAGALVDAAAEVLEGGVTAVQLREKDLPPEELLPLARLLRVVTRNQAAFILNGPLEVALAAEADGVHLPENAVMVERPQRPFLIGRSVHSLEAAERARAEGSDYLIAGPIFQTASHPNAKPAGLELIESIVGVVTAPVLAVGGITDRRVRDVVRAGASGVAVISYILSARSPGRASQALRTELDEAWTATDRRCD